jgi:hypothetical protein
MLKYSLNLVSVIANELCARTISAPIDNYPGRTLFHPPDHRDYGMYMNHNGGQHIFVFDRSGFRQRCIPALRIARSYKCQKVGSTGVVAIKLLVRSCSNRQH